LQSRARSETVAPTPPDAEKADMTAAGTRPPLTDKKLADLLSLVRGADSVELKLTVPESDQRSAVEALDMDPIDAQIRQVYFFDTPDGTPARYRSVTPAWSDQNLRDLASHVESPLFLAHIRATTGTPVQQTNCHPFRHGRWLFVYNGVINGFHAMRRDLLYAVDSSLFDGVAGSTDSDALFYLALTFGLDDDAIGAVERGVGFVETTAREHGIEHPVQMTPIIQRGPDEQRGFTPQTVAAAAR
jgi:hypothetical protein